MTPDATIEPGYIANLRQLSAGLALHAAEARRRQIYGLERALIEASASAASWANALEEDLAAQEEATR